MKQRKRISKAISLITSILLIVLGILALVARDNFSWALGIISGVFLIAVGVVSIIYAVVIKKMILGSGWLIIQGILAIVLGVVLCTIGCYFIDYFIYIGYLACHKRRFQNVGLNNFKKI